MHGPERRNILAKFDYSSGIAALGVRSQRDMFLLSNNYVLQKGARPDVSASCHCHPCLRDQGAGQSICSKARPRRSVVRSCSKLSGHVLMSATGASMQAGQDPNEVGYHFGFLLSCSVAPQSIILFFAYSLFFRKIFHIQVFFIIC